MGEKRLKIAKGINNFIPVSINFSQLEKEYEVSQEEFDPGDSELEKKRIQDDLEYEEMVIQILCNLEKREKLIFVFQLLRDGGFQIDHGSFAKVLGLSRRQYMRVLDEVRYKAALFIAGYNDYAERHKETK